jgi:hypothetical protein
VAVRGGDRILFDKYGQEITLAGEPYLILRENEVLAVIDIDARQKTKAQTGTKPVSRKPTAKRMTKRKKARRK